MFGFDRHISVVKSGQLSDAARGSYLRARFARGLHHHLVEMDARHVEGFLIAVSEHIAEVEVLRTMASVS